MMIHYNSLESSMRAYFFVLQQQQNLGRRFGTSKCIYPPPPVALAAVRSKVVVLLLLICFLLILPLLDSVIVCVHSCFALILMGKRALVALLCLSSWCLMIVMWLIRTMPRVCLQFVIVVFPDHTHLLFQR